MLNPLVNMALSFPNPSCKEELLLLLLLLSANHLFLFTYNCLFFSTHALFPQFRSLSDQLYRTPEHHKFVRQQVVNQVGFPGEWNLIFLEFCFLNIQ